MRTFWYVTLFVLAFSAKQAAAEPLYWQAKKDDLTLTILSSVHVGDESMYPLPAQITDTLKQSDGLIVETDIRKTEGVVYPTTTVTTGDVLNKEQKQLLASISKSLDMPTQQLLGSPPWATSLSIQMQQLKKLGYGSASGVDATLAYKATTQDVPVISLEPLQFQIDLIAGQKDSGKEWLVSSLDEFDQTDRVVHCLIESWKAGDVAKLEEFAKLSEMPSELEKAFLTDRNIDWANKLSANDWKLDSKGHYVLVVGTLHLIGKGNLLQLLEEKYFNVTLQSQSQQAQCQFEVSDDS
ncbi:TraB/GumN family protein [Vibrio lentus]|uniref:TraB/GumN family protein n=1 Tax=Vibrio lentus TaxID=136468 RepID=UPI000C818318|nr:TraB/GumN family protein [Vibrio lentus]PMJ85194.1 polysaccharide biosynthesis protein GumN [Vibrio lentus]PMN37830.1 polysaccharide biosynthesis protein GumN [Vibrio lentus]PMN61270.1 polysaccharide biosynthesis protein GumN [Vibrio lentus]